VGVGKNCGDVSMLAKTAEKKKETSFLLPAGPSGRDQKKQDGNGERCRGRRGNRKAEERLD